MQRAARTRNVVLRVRLYHILSMVQRSHSVRCLQSCAERV
jgi:hypothetical protein